MRLMMIVMASICLAGCSDSGDVGKADSPRVYFVEPKDGATVKKPVKVVFGIEGMDIAPAGTDKPNSGHHHLLINVSLEDYASPIPSDENHMHFGKGQTETTLDLAPGKHTLQLVLGDMNHMPHKPAVESEVITITVTE